MPSGVASVKKAENALSEFHPTDTKVADGEIAITGMVASERA